MITLINFENNLSSVLLERGYDYFLSECVDNLEKIASGVWMAEVHGIDTYAVEVRTHRTQIKGWECDCPYDHGPICKHVIATFYAIAERMELEISHKKKESGRKKSNRKEKLGIIFKKASKEDLQQFIVSQFRRDYALMNALIAHFAELLNENQDEKYRTIIRHMYKAARGRQGFIDYYSAKTLTSSLFDLAQKSEALRVKKNITEALAICKTIIEEVPVFINNMDDSDGGAADAIDYAFDTHGRPDWETFPEFAAMLMAYYTTRCKFEKENCDG